MIIDLDPKNDYAFKRVFGSEHRTRILVHLLNAVLKPPPEHRVKSVEILNPFTEPAMLDEKLAILDVRVREQSGRQFNVEMQMVAPPTVRGRFLFYWADLFSGQLKRGEQYDLLSPVISICFVDGLLFPQTEQYHLPFALWEPQTGIKFTDLMAIHLFQLPNFRKRADELVDPLDVWLYFLNNGKGLDSEHLPDTLRIQEVEEAVEVLTVLTQDELERQRYYDREKARRDALSWEKAYERRFAEGEAAGRAAGEAAGRAAGILIGQIRLCEQFLKRTPMAEDQLNAMSQNELQQVLDQLRAALPS